MHISLLGMLQLPWSRIFFTIARADTPLTSIISHCVTTTGAVISPLKITAGAGTDIIHQSHCHLVTIVAADVRVEL
jgi:hypothetical protein